MNAYEQQRRQAVANAERLAAMRPRQLQPPTPSQQEALDIIIERYFDYRVEQATLGYIAERVGKSKTTVHGLVDRLIAKGYVHQPQRGDRGYIPTMPHLCIGQGKLLLTDAEDHDEDLATLSVHKLTHWLNRDLIDERCRYTVIVQKCLEDK